MPCLKPISVNDNIIVKQHSKENMHLEQKKILIISPISLLLTCSSDPESTNFFVNIAVCFDLLKVDFYLRVKIYVAIMCSNDGFSSMMI